MSEALPQPPNTVPNVAREGGLVAATELTFDERQEWLGGLDEDFREDTLAALPHDVRLSWQIEELKHLEELVKDQPVDGGEFGEDPNEQVIIPGAEEPQDRAPDVGAELIAELVKQKFVAEQEAAKLKRALDEANAEIQAYYEKFGQL